MASGGSAVFIRFAGGSLMKNKKMNDTRVVWTIASPPSAMFLKCLHLLYALSFNLLAISYKP